MDARGTSVDSRLLAVTERRSRMDATDVDNLDDTQNVTDDHRATSLWLVPLSDTQRVLLSRDDAQNVTDDHRDAALWLTHNGFSSA